MRTVSESEAAKTLPSLIEETHKRAVLIESAEHEAAVLISEEDYEIVRKAKAQELLEVMDHIGERVQRQMAKDGISPEEMAKALDRKAS